MKRMFPTQWNCGNSPFFRCRRCPSKMPAWTTIPSRPETENSHMDKPCCAWKWTAGTLQNHPNFRKIILKQKFVAVDLGLPKMNLYRFFQVFFFPLLSPHLTMNQALPVGGLGTLTNLFPKAQVAFTDGHISEYKLEALVKVLKTLAVGMGRNVNKRCGLIRTGFPTKNIGSMRYGKFTYTWMVRWFLW